MKRETIVITTPSGLRRQLFPLASFVVLAAIFAWLVARSHGINPTVFADEWYYSKMARLQPLAEAIVPSYLYLWLFGAANACKAGFLDCVRGANALLMVAAAPFVYQIARSVSGRRSAAAIALLATLAPLNLFVAYFMPETMYYLGFCVLSWVALTRRDWHWALHALACGVLLGLMSLVKVHALFLLPALLLFLAGARWLAGPRRLANGLLAMAACGGAMFAVKFGLGYLLAGAPALSLFGPFYTGSANAAGAGDKLRLLQPAFVIGRAHLALLVLAFGLPLAILLQDLLRLPRLPGRGPRQQQPSQQPRSQVRPSSAGQAAPGQAGLVGMYTLLMLGAAAGMTVLYTATLAAPGSNEGLRMHVRYYSFLFPLLWVVAAAIDRPAAPPPAPRRTPVLRWTLALLLGALLLGTLLASRTGTLPAYVLNAVDGPEAYALRLDQPLNLALLALQVAVLLLWAAGQASARRLFLFVATPLYVAGGIAANQAQLRQFVDDQAADMAGKAAYRLVPPAERGKITVAGAELGQIMRAQFHIDDKDTAMLVLPGDAAPIQPYQLPMRNKWLLVFGKHPLPPDLARVAGNDHYALVRAGIERRVVGSARFNQPQGAGGLLSAIEGVGQIEPFGRWSTAKQVVLHFNAPLPPQAFIVLKAWAYGDNAGLPFTLRSGAASTSFGLSAAPQEVGLRLDTDGRQRSLVIEVPHPVSPREYGDPRDARTLGVALAEIEVSTPLR